jgi:hypothetical protein
VSVLDDPLTEYQRFSLLAYVESQAAGDRMLVIQRRDVPTEARTVVTDVASRVGISDRS